MEIRELRQDTITDADAAELARLRSLVDPRRLRSDPPLSPQMVREDLWPSAPTWVAARWGLFDGEEMVGFSEAMGAFNAENADLGEVGVWIGPDCDRALQRQLFDHTIAVERERGRTRFEGWGDLDDEATRSFWEDEVGYSLAYDERISRCRVGDIDTAMLHRWIERAGERAAGYELIRAQSPFTDEQLTYYAAGLEGMNDAPLDGLIHEPERFDADRARKVEKLHAEFRNSEYRAVFVVETATGELAGFTATRVPRSEPALSKQGDTVTIAAHRNKGIGRWIKADMILWLQEARPEVEHLDTGNAESNRAMLDINEAMGFTDVLHHGVWHEPNPG